MVAVFSYVLAVPWCLCVDAMVLPMRDATPVVTLRSLQVGGGVCQAHAVAVTAFGVAEDAVARVGAIASTTFERERRLVALIPAAPAAWQLVCFVARSNWRACSWFAFHLA